MGIIGYDDLAEYVRQHYPQGSRIVEVGVGRHPDIALLLADSYDLLCTDVFPSRPDDLRSGNIRYVRDDIFKPEPDLYKNARLIYSIRPPIDMQDSIAAVASSVGSDLLIRPFSSEKTDLSRYFRYFDCINYKKAVFFLYRNNR